MSHKTAKVKIVNNTKKAIESVHVVHKYSNDFKNKKDWLKIPAGGTTPEFLSVDYTTGFLTLGKDWWFVTWVYEDDDNTYFTDPKNLRGFIDGAEKISTIAIKTIAAGAAGGTVAAIAVTELLFNSEGTAGFKQHILRDDDSGKVTTITIKDDNNVLFHSESGDSETGSSSFKA